MNKNNCITSLMKKEWLKTAFLILALMILAALTVFEFTREEKPAYDTVCPIANANVSWNQTFYGR